MEDNTILNTTPTQESTPTQEPQYDDTWTLDAYANDKMPKDYDLKDFDDNFVTIAKELKLTKEQASSLRQRALDQDIEEYLTEQSTKEAAHTKGLQDLQNDWGNTFNFRVQSINKLLDRMDNGNPNGTVHTYLQETGLDNDPRFVRFMDNVVKAITGEDPISAPKNNTISSVDSIKGDIATLMKNKAYWDSSDPEHDMLIQRVQGLYSKLYEQ